MFITGLGTATPSTRYHQKECWDALQDSVQFKQFSPRSRVLLKRVLSGSNGITTRHLAMANLQEAFEVTPDKLHERFRTHAPQLASEAAARALNNAGLGPEQINAVIISTCTGYLCPGLTSYVSERLGLRPAVFGLDLVGQGCGAALPNLRAAEALLRSGQYQRVLSICVEVCSAAIYFDDDPGVLISACLFGDGAGAAVLENQPRTSRKVEWLTCGSLMNCAHRDRLRFEQANGLLRNILTPEVPALAGQHARQVLAEVLGRGNFSRENLCGWVLHPGGREVILALRESLELRPEHTRWSEAILDEYGNLSSPSVFFVLNAALNDSVPRGHWWMSSFGAGFSCHGAILKVD